jgi:hypothetical protein
LVVGKHRRASSSRQEEDNSHGHYNNDGYDGDLDEIATALRILWELQSPYVSSSSLTRQGDYFPTPPLSVLHVVRSFTKVSDGDEMSIRIVILMYQFS